MRVLAELHEYYDYVESLITEDIESAFISSYGIYAGIAHDGRDLNALGPTYQTRTKALLDKLCAVPNVNIVIGIASYHGCGKNVPCYHCQYNYYKSLLRLLNHKEQFPNFNWRIAEDNHLKCIAFIYNNNGVRRYSGVAGGRNLNDSNWIDCAFAIDEEAVKSILKKMIQSFRSARKLTGKYLNELSIKYDISSNVIESLMIESE